MTEDGLILETVQRWQVLRDERAQQLGCDPGDLTYCVVVESQGLFGGHVGAIAQHVPARDALIRALEGRFDRVPPKGLQSFVALALCDLARVAVGPSTYEAMAVVLGKPASFLGGNSPEQRRVREFLRRQNVFAIRTGQRDQRLYISSLLRFVPAYRMDGVELQHLIVSLMAEMAPEWLSDDGPMDRVDVARRLAQRLDSRHREDLTEVLTDLLAQLHRSLRLAVEMSDFDTLDEAAFSGRHVNSLGTPPLAGQPMHLAAIWQDFRAWAGAAGSDVRLGVDSLIRRVRAGEIVHGPEGSIVRPEHLTAKPHHEIPWGRYRGQEADLLVSNCRPLLTAPEHRELGATVLVPPAWAQWRMVGSAHWVVANRSFDLIGRGPSSPLAGGAAGAALHVRRVAPRSLLSCSATDGSGLYQEITTDVCPSEKVVSSWWALRVDGGHPRLALTLSMPGSSTHPSIEIAVEGRPITAVLAYERTYLQLEQKIIPGQQVTLRRGPDLIAEIRAELANEFTLFIPQRDGHRYEAISPRNRISYLPVNGAFLLGPKETVWRLWGAQVVGPIDLGLGWEDFRVWGLQREQNRPFVRIETNARSLWEWLRRDFVMLQVDGGRLHEGLVIYDDPAQVWITVEGHLGRRDQPPAIELILSHGDCRVVIPLQAKATGLYERFSVKSLIGRLGDLGSWPRRWSVAVNAPPEVDQVGSWKLDLSCSVRLRLRGIPRVRPVESVIDVVVDAPPAGAALELEDPVRPGHWLGPPSINGVSATWRIDLTSPTRSSGRLALAVRLDGIVYPEAVTGHIEVVGLLVRTATTVSLLSEQLATTTADGEEDLDLEARHIEKGESLEIVATPTSLPLISLTHDCPLGRLIASQLPANTPQLLARLSTNAGGEQTSLGRVVIRRESKPTIDGVAQQGRTLEVLLGGVILPGEIVRVILVGPTGYDEDEIRVEGPRSVSSVLLTLPHRCPPGDYWVLIRVPGKGIVQRVQFRVAAIEGALTMVRPPTDPPCPPDQILNDWATTLALGVPPPEGVPEWLDQAGRWYAAATHRQLLQAVWNTVSNPPTPTSSLSPPFESALTLLRVLCILRLGATPHFVQHFDAANQNCEAGRRVPLELAEAWLQLNAIREMLRLRVPGSLKGMERRGLSRLSPRTDDRALAAALAGDLSSWIDAAKQDPLAAWLGWRLYVTIGADESLKSRLHRFVVQYAGDFYPIQQDLECLARAEGLRIYP